MTNTIHDKLHAAGWSRESKAIRKMADEMIYRLEELIDDDDSIGACLVSGLDDEDDEAQRDELTHALAVLVAKALIGPANIKEGVAE